MICFEVDTNTDVRIFYPDVPVRKNKINAIVK